MTSATRDIKPVLFVLTSHGVKAKPANPQASTSAKSPIPSPSSMPPASRSSSPRSMAASRPSTASTSMTRPMPATGTAKASATPFATRRAFPTSIRKTTPPSSSLAVTAQCGTSRQVWPSTTSPAISTRRVSSPPCATPPAALVNITLSNGAHLVAGKNVAAFTDDEERAVKLDKTDKTVPFLLASTLVARGAHHHPAADWTAKVVVDGRLVTGQNPQSATGVGEALRDLRTA